MASFALSIVGTAIGGPIGGAIGSAIGGMIDNVLFPHPQPALPQITSSTYGNVIPWAMGPQNRVGGNMIWTSGWRNTSSNSNKGLQVAFGKGAGKGGPPQQVADVAIAVCRGPLDPDWGRKIFANGNLIFDADRAVSPPTPDAQGAVTWPHDGGTHKDFDTITFYPGSANALPDPTMEATLGVGNVPAYRGTAYFVMRQLQGTPFGNAVPVFQTITRAQTSITLAQVINMICERCGVDPRSMVSSGRLTQTIDGYTISGQTDGIGAIQPLALVYNFDVAEVAGELRFQPRGDPGLCLIRYDRLAAHPYGDDPPDAFAWPRAPESSLPQQAAITFNDPARDLNSNTQTASRSGGSATSNIASTVMLTMTADVGRKVADRMLWEAWTGRQGFSGATDDRLGYLESGRNYYIETPVGAELVRLTTRTRGVNGVIEFEAKRDAPSIYVSTAPGASANSQANELGLGGPVNPPVFIEPPSTFPGITSPTLFIALSGGDGVTANDAWGGCSVYMSSDDVTGDYTLLGQQLGVSCMGKLTNSIANGSGSNPDTAHTLSITTEESGGEPLPSSALDASVAQIPYFVQGEWMTAEDVNATGDDDYDLTRLWRGLYNSDKSSHSIGDVFVRVDSLVFKATMPAGYVGQELFFRFVSAGENLTSVTTYSYTPTGHGYGGGSGGVPVTPSAPTTGVTGAGNVVAWDPPPATDNVGSTTILRADGSGASIGAAIEVGVAGQGATSFTDTSAVPGQAYTYFVVHNNVVGPSDGSAGSDASTSLGTGPWGVSFSCQEIATKTNSAVLGRAAIPFGWTLPATSSSPAGYVVGKVDVAPIADTDFVLLKDGVNVGTVRFASGSTTPVLIKASDTAFVDTDYLDLETPANFHGMSGVFALAVIGAR